MLSEIGVIGEALNAASTVLAPPFGVNQLLLASFLPLSFSLISCWIS
jgi:hypothetical protein